MEAEEIVEWLQSKDVPVTKASEGSVMVSLDSKTTYRLTSINGKTSWELTKYIDGESEWTDRLRNHMEAAGAMLHQYHSYLRDRGELYPE